MSFARDGCHQVRANDRGSVGFMADWRRANVALTRAQRGAIVVGHTPTLSSEGRAWGPLLAFLFAQVLINKRRTSAQVAQ